ncbi:MAG: Holliday junction resolvase RuvX [Synergistaceae bacterium]|jgi:putative Holliday junction resolvase|nr:Holliday junction resolvase RuvX [Synergistaceae bacterium]
MKRIIALDIGTVRIGVAVSDQSGIFAQGVAVLRTDENWLDRLSGIISEYDAGPILAGIPRRTDGSEGPEAVRTKRVIAVISERFPEHEIITWDERFTTVIANQVLIGADVSRAGRKSVVDKVAAAVLLQSYLDSKRPPAPAAPDIPPGKAPRGREVKPKHRRGGVGA